MGVAIPDTAVPAVDEQFAVLIPSDLTRGINGLALGPVDRSGTLTTGSADGPSAIVRNNVLITFRHVNLLIQKVFLPDHPCFRQRGQCLIRQFYNYSIFYRIVNFHPKGVRCLEIA